MLHFSCLKKIVSLYNTCSHYYMNTNPCLICLFLYNPNPTFASTNRITSHFLLHFIFTNSFLYVPPIQVLFQPTIQALRVIVGNIFVHLHTSIFFITYDLFFITYDVFIVYLHIFSLLYNNHLIIFYVFSLLSFFFIYAYIAYMQHNININMFPNKSASER